MFNSSPCRCFNAEHLFGGIALFCLPSLSLPFKIPFPLRRGLAVSFQDFSLLLSISRPAISGDPSCSVSQWPSCPKHLAGFLCWAPLSLTPYAVPGMLLVLSWEHVPHQPSNWEEPPEPYHRRTSLLRGPEARTACSRSGKGLSLSISTLYHQAHLR
jgi:hypothetical protein